LQQQAAEEVDKEAIFSDKIITVDMPSPSAVRQRSALGESIIPVSGAEKKYIRGDVGSPASTMHEQMRSTGYTDEAIDDMGLLPGQEMEFLSTADDIDLEAIMQRYSNPQEVIAGIDPVIAVPPSVNLEKAFRSSISPRGDPRDLPIGPVPPAESISYGVPTGRVSPRVERQLDLPIMGEPTPEVVVDLRRRAADIRRRGGQFQGETAGLNLQQREQAWEEIRSRPEFRKYLEDQTALKREIGVTAPDIMEFDPYTRAQRTELISRESVPSLSRIKEASGKEKKLLESNRKIAISRNKFLDKREAEATGFIKKDGTPDIAAWKKAGKPKRLDLEDRFTDKLVKPKQKLVDSFKKGSKIVNRKRGGMIKKPKGWGAARYKGK
jgi:hypothetical protein